MTDPIKQHVSGLAAVGREVQGIGQSSSERAAKTMADCINSVSCPDECKKILLEMAALTLERPEPSPVPHYQRSQDLWKAFNLGADYIRKGGA